MASTTIFIPDSFQQDGNFEGGFLSNTGK